MPPPFSDAGRSAPLRRCCYGGDCPSGRCRLRPLLRSHRKALLPPEGGAQVATHGQVAEFQYSERSIGRGGHDMAFGGTRRRNMRPHLYGTIAIAITIATPAMAQQTTTPTANTMSSPGSGAGTSPPTLSHDGSASLTNSNASRASNSPGAGASPHTGFSSGMTPSAGTASGTADGTTDTGATSPGSGKSAAPR
jgi:hypothetical protein